jgi:hypothetical protein
MTDESVKVSLNGVEGIDIEKDGAYIDNQNKLHVIIECGHNGVTIDLKALIDQLWKHCPELLTP